MQHIASTLLDNETKNALTKAQYFIVSMLKLYNNLLKITNQKSNIDIDKQGDDILNEINIVLKKNVLAATNHDLVLYSTCELLSDCVWMLSDLADKECECSHKPVFDSKEQNKIYNLVEKIQKKLKLLTRL